MYINFYVNLKSFNMFSRLVKIKIIYAFLSNIINLGGSQKHIKLFSTCIKFYLDDLYGTSEKFSLFFFAFTFENY